MQLFIDSNIFLSFYHLTSEDLEELEKLAVLISNKEVTLLLPQQVIDETWRNRASKIQRSFEDFKRSKFSLSYPAYCKSYNQYAEMRELQKRLEELHAGMVAEIQEDIAAKTLVADMLIQKLFGIAEVIPRSSAIVAHARERMELGNPPGKKGSLGDAINWESLLASVPEWSSLALVADDSDFSSPLDAYKVADFLLEEWRARKSASSDICFYRKLSMFFKRHYPSINLKAEIDKDALIEQLAGSQNFATTHSLIAKLSKYDEFAQKQVEELADALLANNQINWIIGDDDVYSFYKKLYDNNVFLKFFYSEELEKLLDSAKDPVINLFD